jgi:hypothetical protein
MLGGPRSVYALLISQSADKGLTKDRLAVTVQCFYSSFLLVLNIKHLGFKKHEHGINRR